MAERQQSRLGTGTGGAARVRARTSGRADLARLLRRCRSPLVPRASERTARRCQSNWHRRGECDTFIRTIPAEPCRIPLAAPVPSQSDSQSHAARVRGPMSRRLWTGSAMLWTLAVTILRAARLPNDFAKEHWFIDYRFGFVKR